MTKNTQIIDESFKESIQVKQKTFELLRAQLEKVIQSCIACVQQNRTIYWAGNGGSAADAQHMAAELVGRFKKERKPIRSVALTTNTSIVTAIGNDYGYEHIFERQLEAFAESGDILIAISTSGNSLNVIRAAEMARQKGLTVIGLTGETGGKLASLCDLLLNVPSTMTARIQENHFLLEHIICEAVEESVCF